MSFRTRVVLTSLVTLAVGLGALLVAGNVLLDRRVHTEATNLLRAKAQAVLATLTVDASGIEIREAPNDQNLDREAWILEGDRVLEGASHVRGAVEQEAIT